MNRAAARPIVAIACGGTGGHLFPGLAVGRALRARGADVTLLVSRKEIDQLALRGVKDFTAVALPAVGLSGRNYPGFALGFARAWLAARATFRRQRPHAVLAMGGFTSAPPVLAGRACGAATFLHEGNSIPGRANRWLARRVDEAFVYFPGAVPLLGCPRARVVGMPVRAEFTPREPLGARASLGLDPSRPVLLVMGGSQGATGVNDLVLRSLAHLLGAVPGLQILHLAGAADQARLREVYQAAGVTAAVHAFLAEMDIALAAATAAVSRAGAGSLAELAAMRLPAVLIPYPLAADDHQRYNAQAFVDTGAAWLLDQATATPEQLVALIHRLCHDQTARAAMKEALAKWHSPDAAETMADRILERVQLAQRTVARGEHGTAFIQRPVKSDRHARAFGVHPSGCREEADTLKRGHPTLDVDGRMTFAGRAASCGTHPQPLPGGERSLDSANASTSPASTSPASTSPASTSPASTSPASTSPRARSVPAPFPSWEGLGVGFPLPRPHDSTIPLTA